MPGAAAQYNVEYEDNGEYGGTNANGYVERRIISVNGLRQKRIVQVR